MIHDLKPYPTCRASGIPWVGDIPEPWSVNRAKWLFRKMDRPVRDDDDVVTCFRDGVVTLRKKRRVRGCTESLKEIGYQGIRSGDLVIHAMDAFAGAVGVSDADGKGSPVYSVCTPASGVNPYYYALVIREMARNQWILALARGIRERSTDFRFSDFGSELVPLPPLSEQDAIVRFLDHADHGIRRYILAKQELIKALGEQKQSIVELTVTRGLNSNVHLKPTGVEWLDYMPEHWSAERLKFVARDIVDCVHATPVYSVDAAYPAIRTADVTPGALLLPTARRVDEEHYRLWTQRMVPNEGDILYTREGERFAAGYPDLCYA